MLHLVQYHGDARETASLLERTGIRFNQHGFPIFPAGDPPVTRALIKLGNMMADAIVTYEQGKGMQPEVVVAVNTDRQHLSATALANVIIARIDEKLGVDLDRLVVTYDRGGPLISNDHGVHVDRPTSTILGRRMVFVTDLIVRNGFVARTIKSALSAKNQGVSLDTGGGKRLIGPIVGFICRDNTDHVDNGHIARFGFAPDLIAFLEGNRSAPSYPSSAELPSFQMGKLDHS